MSEFPNVPYSVLLIAMLVYTTVAHDNVFPVEGSPSDHKPTIQLMDMPNPAGGHIDDVRHTDQETHFPPGVSPTVYEHDGQGEHLQREAEPDYETDFDTLDGLPGTTAEKEIPVVVEMETYPPGVPQREHYVETADILTDTQSPEIQDGGTGDNNEINPDEHPSILVPEKDHKHLEQHMEVPLNTTNMNSEELAFHYFKMHDTDNNENLDGLELIKYMIHFHEHEEGRAPRVYGDEELAASVDRLLTDNDQDNDGYISYAEYKQAYEKTTTANTNT